MRRTGGAMPNTGIHERYAECPFAHVCLIARCAEADGDCLEQLQMIDLREGDALFQRGSPAAGCYVLCRGRAKLTYRQNGHTLCLDIVSPGQILGEEAFCDPLYRTSAEALEESSVVYLERSRLRGMLEAHPELNLWVLKTLSRRCKALHERAVASAYAQASERLVEWLRSLEDQYGSCIPLSQAELAQLMGVGRDTINRCLKELERQGAIQVSRRVVRLVDLSPQS